MNPRATVQEPVKTDTRSPFEQITQLENEQEARVQEALIAYATEEREAEKAMANAEKLHEEKAREEAREDLREYANKEPAAILEQGEAQAAEALKAIAKNYQKNAPKVIESLTGSVLHLSI